MTSKVQAKAIAQEQNLTEEAELTNGRFAMIGIIAALPQSFSLVLQGTVCRYDTDHQHRTQ